MSESALKRLKDEAATAASQNSPLHVLDTAVLGVLVGIGWFVGRLWYGTVFTVVFLSHALVAYIFAVRHGYRIGTKKKVAVPEPAPQPAPPPELLADNPIRDAYRTPFGVPFGPNVQAYSEPG